MTPSQGLISAGSMFEGAHVCESAWSDFLYDLVSSHARYMAEHQKQGHQYFEQRFLIVRKELGLKATEICAESWEWQTILPYDQLGTEMFSCWSMSKGHWKVASTKHKYWAGDMCMGKNGIWYACILVAD